MPDSLSFRLRLKRGAGFTLDIEERIPLKGITAISGPSGSGKTTLLRALAGLEDETSGTRSVRFGEQIWDDERASLSPEDRRIGMVFQEPALFPHLTVGGNIDYGARRRKVKTTDAIVEALDLGPLISRGVIGLSGGEARRVALARALASDPALLLLDEPMSGLDDKRKASFLPYVARAVSAAMVPTIYVSHASDEITTLADRILSLREGRSQGWQTPPMRLVGVVAGHSDSGAIVCVGPNGSEQELVLPIRAFIGERIGLGLSPETILLSSNHPGQGTALATLPAELVDLSDRTLLVSGQKLLLPASVSLPSETSHLWLSILKVFPRPELSDSDL